MKSLLTFAALLSFASYSFAAIEFSEDVAADLPDSTVVTATADAAANAGSVAVTSSASQSAPANTASGVITKAMASGSAGSMGTSSGLANAGLLGGGGGSSAEAGSTDDLLAAAAPASEDATTSGTADDAAPNEPEEAVAMPEPSTAVVWSLLAVFGFAAVRRRTK